MHMIFTRLLAAAFASAGLFNSIATSTTRTNFVRWGYPAWWCRVTGGLEISAAILVAIPATRAAGLILCAVILAAETDERFSLPECESARATDSLRDLARAARIERAAVVEPQSLRSGADEKSCKATLALDEGAAVGVRYRFYWDGWTQKIEFTDADE